MKTSESASVRWARIIVEQRSSELSIAEFCRRHELSAPSFFAWRRRLGAGRRGPAFVEVKVEGPQQPEQMPASPAPLELQPGGRFRGRILVPRGFDRRTLQELLEALEAWS
jgi:hypothetical protein